MPVLTGPQFSNALESKGTKISTDGRTDTPLKYIKGASDSQPE